MQRTSWQWCAGSTYAPEGRVLTESGAPVQAPAEESAVLQAATCCALCNDSTLTYNTGVLHCTRVTMLLICTVIRLHPYRRFFCLQILPLCAFPQMDHQPSICCQVSSAAKVALCLAFLDA